MTSDNLFIGIDSGTQGTKAIVFDQESNAIVAEAYAPHSLVESSDGKREQDPALWIAALDKVIRSLLNDPNVDPKKIKAMSVSGQQHGMVPLNKSGQVIRPAKLWCDTETTSQCEQITAALGGNDKVIDLIGNSIAVGFTASKILWMKQQEPEKYERLDCVLLPHDYLNYWLTGEKKAEFGDASGTAYFDIKKRAWSQEVINAIDSSGKLGDCLPELIESHEPIGAIRPELSKKYGFPKDLLIASGGGDNMMAAIGTGNVTDGVITASLGTSGTIYTCSSKPIVDKQGELAAFCSSSGSWLPLVCTMNVTVSTELTRNMLNLTLDELNQIAGMAPVGSEGIILLPYFNGERTPALPNASATYFGLSSLNYTQANICRSAMEGATFGLKYGLEVLERSGIAAKEIRLVGGGAKSPLWRQLVADVFNCQVVCPVVDEAGALGAALQSVWCYLNNCGNATSLKEITDRSVSLGQKKVATPILGHVERYKQIYQKYLSVEKSLRPLYD